MRIIDENGNTITDPDLTAGHLIIETVIKEDAEPIDNVTKLAWADDDYEQVQRYIVVPQSVRTEREISKCRRSLESTDYEVIKAAETLITSLTSATSLLGLFKAVKEVHDGIEGTIAQRGEWRERISALEAESASAGE